MKMKILAGTVIAAFTLSLGVISVFATESIINTPNNNVVYHYCGEGCQFIDENGDGICDYYGTGGCYGVNQGQYYVDENGDGVCDNYGTSGCYGRNQNYINTNNVNNNFVPRTHHNNGGWGRHGGGGCCRR